MSGHEGAGPPEDGRAPAGTGAAGGETEDDLFTQQHSTPIGAPDGSVSASGAKPAMVEEALALAAHGYSVFPLHTVADGRCTCGCADSGCHTRGKHPRWARGLFEHGCKDASTDPARIRELWQPWPDANVGIATGGAMLVLDVDVDHGGRASLTTLVAEHGSLPKTVLAVTGSGGWHGYFAVPGGLAIRNSAGQIGAGLDIRGEGGYVVAPPSSHWTGGTYWWKPGCAPWEAPVAGAPEWLLQLITALEASGNDGARTAAPAVGTTSGAVPAERIFEGQRNIMLASLAGGMRHRGMGEAAIRAALLVHNEEACDPPLSEAEVARIAASVAKYPPGAVEAVDVRSQMSLWSRAPRTTLMERPWPEPPDDSAYMGLAGSLVAAIRPHTEADDVAVLAHILCGFGSAVDRGAWVQVGATHHHPRLYLALVGRTSKARKGDSERPVRWLMEAAAPTWAKTRIASGLSTGEGLIYEVRDPVEDGDGNVSDVGVVDKRLHVIEPELGRVLRAMERQGNTLSPILRDAWDGGPLQIMTRTNPIRATGAHISLVGHITAEELKRELDDIAVVNGLANRVCWLAVRRARKLPDPLPMTREMIVRLAGPLAEAIDHGSKAGDMRRTPAARDMWKEMYDSLSDERDGLAGALLARGEAQVTRLSLVYALLDGASAIDEPHLLAAAEFWAYVERSVTYIWGDATGDPTADTIRQALAAGQLTRTQIRDLFGRHASGTRIDQALASLAALGLARPTRTATGGRPTETWELVR